MLSNDQHPRAAPFHVAVALFLAVSMGAGCKDSRETPEVRGAPAAPQAAAAPEAHKAAAPDNQTKVAANAVQAEMRLLTEALRDSVTALGYGNLDAIPVSLHRVHEAREATEQALETGAYKLRKNAGDLKAFEALDEAFHGELEKLANEAKANDSAATGTQLGVVLSKCSGCHSQFRP